MPEPAALQTTTNKESQRPPSCGRINRILKFVLGSGLLYAGLMAWLGVAVLSTRALTTTDPMVPWTVGVGAVLFALASIWTLRRPIDAAFQSLPRALNAGSNADWLIVVIGVGLVARLAWAMAFPANPVSDGRTYLQLAQKILAGEDYGIAGTRAYWPPGYPFYLVPWLWALDNQKIAIVASNFALYLVGALGVFGLGCRLINRHGARLALLLFAIWPNLIFQSSVPEKEQVLVALMPWILLLWCGPKSKKGPTPGWNSIGAGIAFGAAMLVQPAVQFLFAVLFVFGWVATREFRRTVLSMACLFVGAAIVVGPWTWRNIQVFDQFVLVSTNGGFGLFGANNPKATGGYLPIELWPKDLLELPETQADREGKRRAFNWIADNPKRFTQLGLEKNVRFMGDDAAGAYTTLKRGPDTGGGMVYAVFKGISNIFWLGYWWIVSFGLLRLMGQGLRMHPLQMLLPASFLYSFALHSIAESAGKYHVLWTGILCVLLPMIALSGRDKSTNCKDEFLPPRTTQ